MSQLCNCVLIVISVLVSIGVMALEENEELVDDFDTGMAIYWHALPSNSATFWHLTMHGDLLPPGIDIMRPPSDEGDGFLEVFTLSDSPAQIFSNVFDLLPGATVELTYWNFDIAYPVRNTVLLVYNEFKQIDDETGTKPPLKSVLVYSAPSLADQLRDWRIVLIDLKITEPSKIQLRIDGYVVKTNETGLAFTKIVVKNGLEMSTTTGSSSTTEASTVGSTLIHSSTELTSTSSSLSSISTSSSISFTVNPTTIFSSTMFFTVSSSNPSFDLSTTTESSSPGYSIVTSTNPADSMSSTDSSETSTLPPSPGMTENQLRDVLIGVGVSVLLLILIGFLIVFCFKRHRRRAYLIENRQLETGMIRQLKQ